MTAPTEPKLTSQWDVRGHQNNGWPQFLHSVSISGLRGWRGETVEFRYPVVAIAGANGSGKSTILKAAASAYEAPLGGESITYSPDDFFPNTPWEDVARVSLTFSIRQGHEPTIVSLRKPTSRWRGFSERKKRQSFFLDVSRIQPANTQIGYGKSAQKLINAGDREVLTPEQTKQLSRTIGRAYETAEMATNDNKQIGIVAQNGQTYSNFHQGAGEDSALDLLYLLGKAPAGSLILIDEIEAALHPKAQRGLVNELLRIATEKHLQVIVTTHSPYILEQLPTRARIYIATDRNGDRDVVYGVSTEFAMGLMDDEHHTELDLYCEDEAASVITDHLVRLAAAEAGNRVRITSVGPADVVKTLGRIASEGKFTRPGIGVLDGDQEISAGCVVLPGEKAPEKELFHALNDQHWSAVAERLGYSPGSVLDARDSAMRIENHHAWTETMARTLGGLTRGSVVWEAVVSVWVRDIVGQTEAREWFEPIENALARIA